MYYPLSSPHYRNINAPLTHIYIDLLSHVRFPVFCAGSIQKCTWYSDAEQNAVVDDGNETQDTFGLLQLLGFQAQLLVAGRRHIGPVDHDLGGSPGEVKKREVCLQLISKESFTNIGSLNTKNKFSPLFQHIWG